MYFYVEENDKIYSIRMTEEFYNLTYTYFHDSYFNIFYRLFDLLPQDFYHYVGAKYHAYFKKSDCLANFVKMYFKNKVDAQNFCAEVNRRFQAVCGN